MSDPTDTPSPPLAESEREILLPCPFCGSEAELRNLAPHTHGPLAGFMPDHPGSWAIECFKCSAGQIRFTRAEVAAAWNVRQAIDPNTEAALADMTAQRDAAEARAEQAFRAGLERAAQVCEAEAVEPDSANPDPTDVSYNWALEHAAAALRALADQPAAAGSPWRTMDTCPDEDGKTYVIIIGGKYTKPTRKLADGQWWNYLALEAPNSAPTHWMPDPLASLPPAPGDV